jgi:hypothetical protein
MKLTIISDNNLVKIDGIGYRVDLSSLPRDIHAVQWDGSSGEIEFRNNANGKPNNQQIFSIENFQQFVDLWVVADEAHNNSSIPTEEQLLELTRIEADRLLQESDWAMLPDVTLQNKAEWEAYRVALRNIRSNLTVDPAWPTEPDVVW